LFESVYGPLRGAVTRAVERFRKCGILHYGFARLKCQGCGRNRFLAYSCRTRQFCPSCAAKRVAAFTDWVASEVLEPVSHRQVVFTIPNVPDAVWTRDGRRLPISYLDPQALTRIFQGKGLPMLVNQRCLSREFAARLLTWRHSGFQVYRAESVEPDDRRALERLCAYIGRAVFASSRVEYDPSSGAVHYQTAKGAQLSLDALEWIALVTQHVPDPGEHTRRSSIQDGVVGAVIHIPVEVWMAIGKPMPLSPGRGGESGIGHDRHIGASRVFRRPARALHPYRRYHAAKRRRIPRRHGRDCGKQPPRRI
jgi:hypothetical protein